MTKILDGRIVREKVRAELAGEIKKLKVKPTLVIIQVGDVPASTAYIKQKISFGESIGAKIIHQHLPVTISEDKLITDIENLNQNKEVRGIIVQLPLPNKLKEENILAAINPHKDVDGLVNPGVTPATARGIITLLDYYGIKLGGKHVVVIGRSALVGKPVSQLLLGRDATVTVCHSKTKQLAKFTQQADIIVIATGKPKLLKAKHVRRGQTIIDVGITRMDEGLVGDVDFKKVAPLVRAISPVPGGVGPLTVASLFQNLLDLVTIS